MATTPVNAGTPASPRLIVAIACIIAVLFGLVLLFTAETVPAVKVRPWLASPLHHLGAFLIGGSVVAFTSEILIRRLFLSEIAHAVNHAVAGGDAGIDKVCSSFYEGVAWCELFESTKSVRVCFCNGDKWSQRVSKELTDFSARKHCSLTVILPNPGDSFVIAEAALRNRTLPEHARRITTQRDRVNEGVRIWTDWVTKVGSQSSASSTVLLSPRAPLYTIYLFDSTAILSLYTYRSENGGEWPVLICHKGGTMFEHLEKEFEALKSGSAPCTGPVQADTALDAQFKDWAAKT